MWLPEKHNSTDKPLKREVMQREGEAINKEYTD